MIWKFVLPENPPIPTSNHELHFALRYKPNGKVTHRVGGRYVKKRWRAWSAMPAASGLTERLELLVRFENVIPISYRDFLNLVMVSRSVSVELLDLFYGNTLFMFENRLAVHLFLDTIGSNRKRLRSLSICLHKSQGPYPDEIIQKYEEWKVKNSSPGPSLVVTFKRLQKECERLNHLELWFKYGYHRYPATDNKYMGRTKCQEWPWFRALNNLPLFKSFSFCLPTAAYRVRTLRAVAAVYGQKAAYRVLDNWAQLAEIEECMNAEIKRRISR